MVTVGIMIAFLQTQPYQEWASGYFSAQPPGGYFSCPVEVGHPNTHSKGAHFFFPYLHM